MARRNGLQSRDLAWTWETGAVSYVGPYQFLVTGRNATLDYVSGAVVSVNGRLAGVLTAEYSDGNTTVTLGDAVCFSGMSGVKRMLGVTTGNLCTGGTPISGGDAGSYPASNAFNGLLHGVLTSYLWLSSQTSSHSGNAFIGYSWSTAKKIRWVRLIQAMNNGSSIGAIPLVYLQYWNGSAWASPTTFSYDLAYNNLQQNILINNDGISATQWRLMAASSLTGLYWGVADLQMGE